MFVFVLQGARGNDGAAGAAGPPVSIFIYRYNNNLSCCSTCKGAAKQCP